MIETSYFEIIFTDFSTILVKCNEHLEINQLRLRDIFYLTAL